MMKSLIGAIKQTRAALCAWDFNRRARKATIPSLAIMPSLDFFYLDDLYYFEVFGVRSFLGLNYVVVGASGSIKVWNSVGASVDGSSVSFIGSCDVLSAKITFSSGENESRIRLFVELHFNKATAVEEIDIVISGAEILACYDYIGRLREYDGIPVILNKGRVRLRSKAEQDVVVSIPDGESIEVNGRDSLKLVLDHKDYHQKLQFPYRTDGTASADFNSARVFEAGSDIRYQAVFEKISRNAPIVVPWLHRNGSESTYIWTEHACHTDVNTHKAVYFGSSKFSNPSESTGGFVYHKIPITKSIHWSNRGEISNKGQSTLFPWPMAAVAHADFRDFISSLAFPGSGVELCLHCADPASSSREQTETALAGLAALSVPSKTWIDHIWLKPDGNVSGCAEAFVCEGFVPSSEFNLIDVWRKAGVRYFWNPVYEYRFDFFRDIRPRVNGEPFYRFTADCEKLGIRFKWFWPVTGGGIGAYSWATIGTEQVGGVPGDWQTAYSESALNEFVRQNALFINHSYPTYAGDTSAFIRCEAGETRIASELDEVLARMAEYKRSLKINFETIGTFFEHFVASECVDILRIDDATWRVCNRGDGHVKGYSIAVYGKVLRVLSGNESVRIRNLTCKHLISLDLAPKQTCEIRIQTEG